MKITFATAAFLLVPLGALRAADPPDTNYDKAKVPAYRLPDPLVCFDGQPVTDVKVWRHWRQYLDFADRHLTRGRSQ